MDGTWHDVQTAPLPYQGTEPREVLLQLTYAPLPYETHPIDLAYGSQGWGPFHGPWTPSSFASPFWGIDPTWNAGDNDVTYAPAYHTMTVFEDPSVDFVANHGLLSTLKNDLAALLGRGSSTISNGSQADAPGGRLRTALGM